MEHCTPPAPRRWTVSFRDRRTIAEQTSCYTFQKPEGFTFCAGQFATMTCGEERHVFSFASAPEDDHLAFAWRESDSAFKTCMRALHPGATVTLIAPAGRALVPAQDPVLFLAAGVGITPVRSIVRSTVARGVQRDLRVLFANRTPASTPFRDDFIALAQQGICTTHFFYDEAMQQDDAPQLPTLYSHAGRITAAAIRAACAPVAPEQAQYYVVGMRAFVTAMTTLLREALAVPAARITYDDFG